mgnify:CR=1 FL=1
MNVFLLSVAATSAGPIINRPLRRSMEQFQGCVVGSDVDLDRLQQAGADYCDLISQFGRFAKPSVANVRECLHKISVSKKGLGVSSMLALLEGECAAGAHKPGGVLLDPSGAIGLLWVRRGLLFWAHVFEQQAKVMMRPMRGGGSSLKEQASSPL